KDGNKFWEEVNAEAARTNGETIVAYMRLMLEKSKAGQFPVTAEKLKELAGRINYFPGVETYFDRINNYVRQNFGSDIELRHYIISAGLKEIIAGTVIAKYFYKVFASQYYYDEYGAATFPNVIVNDTLKTQFIFRINKGKENLSESINLHMPHAARPIPFQNILYIGDGLTDVPCMTVIRKNGGHAIAVYQPDESRGQKTCCELLQAGRVDFIARADYEKDTELDCFVKLLLDGIAGGIRYEKQRFSQSQKYRL
ncbi:MAG: haloacid dehalogenase-like hydrolase, partial [Planctomycetes bacterium]|nr:haloacid dehalogenase-like hydrolase [Planctomycetota bacterium]